MATSTAYKTSKTLVCVRVYCIFISTITVYSCDCVGWKILQVQKHLWQPISDHVSNYRWIIDWLSPLLLVQCVLLDQIRMVSSANISDKSVYSHKGSKKQKGPSSFSPTSPHKFGHNSAIVSHATNGLYHLVSHVILRTSNDILVINIFFKMMDHTLKTRYDFFDINDILTFIASYQ